MELGQAPTEERGFDVRWLDAGDADYVSKIGTEVARGDLKGTRSPFCLLDEAQHGGGGVRRVVVREYASGMRGRQSIGWSKGLRDLLGLGV